MNEEKKNINLEKAFAKMIKTTRSFDAEVRRRTAQSETAIGNALRRMIAITYKIEKQNERAIRTGIRIQKLQSRNSKLNRSISGKIINSLPAKYRNLPLAFRRNPRLVVKYFLGMILGRLLAIILYIIAALIPAIPIPESAQGLIGKPVRVVGSMASSARNVLFDPTMIANVVTNIPTDINKLLQKIGEFFQFYGKRFFNFTKKAILHPKLAYQDVRKFVRCNVRFFIRLCRSTVAVIFSLVMIKISMIFLLPLFGGIAITIAGLKISILLIVVFRMIFDKIGEFIGNKIFGKAEKFYRQRKTEDSN